MKKANFIGILDIAGLIYFNSLLKKTYNMT